MEKANPRQQFRKQLEAMINKHGVQDVVKISQLNFTDKTIEGTFVSRSQAYEFEVSPAGLSYGLAKNRTDAYVAAVWGERFDKKRCVASTSIPCGASCITNQKRCRISTAAVKQVSQEALATAKELGFIFGKGKKNLQSSPGGRLLDTEPAPLSEMESRIRRNANHEEMVIYDPEGNMISHTKGDQTSVAPPRGLKTLENHTVTHNHPTWRFGPDDPRLEGRGFSSPDLTFAAANKLKEMRAVGPGKSYSVKPGPNGWGNPVLDVVPTYAEKSLEVHQEMQAKIRKGEITAEQAEQDFQGEIAKRVAKELGWKYSEKSTPISEEDRNFAQSAKQQYGVPNWPKDKLTAKYAVQEVIQYQSACVYRQFRGTRLCRLVLDPEKANQRNAMQELFEDNTPE